MAARVEDIEKRAAQFPSSPPLVIHVGHTITQDNSGVQAVRAQQTHVQPESQLLDFLKYFQQFYKRHPMISIAGLCGSLWIYLFAILSERYQRLVDERSWMGLLLCSDVPGEDSEIFSSEFIINECADRYIGYSNHGIMRRALRDSLRELQALHSFCRLFFFMRLSGIGLLNQHYSLIYNKQKSFENFLNRIIRVIASIMVTRYPRKQVS